MIARKLPFMEELHQLEAGGADEHSEMKRILQAEMETLFRQRGWQVIIDMLRRIVDDALVDIAAGERVEYAAGQIAAVEGIREHLREYVSDELVDTFDEGLTDE